MKLKIQYGGNQVSWITCASLAVMMIVALVPYYSRNASHILQYASMIICMFTSYKSLYHLDNKEKYSILIVFIYIFIEAIYKFTGISDAPLDVYFGTVKFFLFYVAFILIRKQISSEQKKVIIIIGLLCYIYTIFTNANYSEIYYHYGTMYSTMPETNAANTAYSTVAMILAGTFFICFIQSKRIIMKIFSISFVALSIYYLVFVSKRGITFILTFLLLIAILIHRKGGISRFIVYFAMIILFLFIVISEDSFANLLIEISGAFPERLAIRIKEVSIFISEMSIDSAGGSFESRVILISNSISTFLGTFSSFLFGVGDQRSSNLIIGNHSQWIDTFARYGIIGGMMLVFVLKTTLSQQREYYKDDDFFFREGALINICFLIRGFLGTAFNPAIGASLFIMIPFIFSLFTKQSRSNLDNLNEVCS